MAKAKPTKKRSAPVKKTPRKPAPARGRTPAKKARPKPSPARAPKTKMAAFSAQVLAEEEKAVQVRTFNEARAGIEASAEFTPKTGEVQPLDAQAPKGKASAAQLEQFLSKRPSKPAAAAGSSADLEFEADGPSAAPTRSLDRKSEHLVAANKRRKPKLETAEDYGKVELRQATASGGRKVASLHKDNLQRAAERLKPLASAEESKTRSKPDTFEVAQDGSARASRMPDISDFGEVEIGQQTLSGSRRVGRLKKADEDTSGDGQ